MARTVLTLRENAEKWHIDADHIVVVGSSAGGHLAASYGMFWSEDWLRERMGLTEAQKELLRPQGMILNYPVITSGKFADNSNICHIEEYL